MSKALSHFKTITRHRHQVIRHCIKAGIPFQGLRHDLSKYSLTEFIPGAKYYAGTRSPNEVEREQTGYSAAWLHHKGRNKHHYEYWIDYSLKPVKCMAGMKMPLKYVNEMVMDRIAASKVYEGKKYTRHSPLAYYEQGKGSYLIHEETRELLEYILHMLDEKGEEKTFAYMKKYMVGKKNYPKIKKNKKI